MRIHVSPSDGTPIYLQIVNQVKYAVASGRLAPGEQLPPVRRLAEQLLVNPNTVARAYRELESAGVVVARHGAGVFLAEHAPSLGKRERQRILFDRADLLLAEARHLGVDVEELIELIRSRHARME